MSTIWDDILQALMNDINTREMIKNTIVKQALLDTLRPDQREALERGYLPPGRRVGKTYLIAVKYLLWALDNIGQETIITDHYQNTSSGDRVLKTMVERLFDKYIKQYGYEIRFDRYKTTCKIKIVYGPGDKK